MYALLLALLGNKAMAQLVDGRNGTLSVERRPRPSTFTEVR
jgi:hypothetical protein